MKKYALGLDFGTLSVRALFVDIETGEEAATAVYEYPHGVMTEALPDGTPLPPDFALEHPHDFLEGLEYVVPAGMRAGGILPEQVIGIGVDITTATVLAVDEEGTPLSDYPEFASRPEAWMKLWKHHGAMQMAERMLEVARERKESWLNFYGDWLSGELFMPKAVELAVNDPEVFERTHNLIEAADWIVWKLTGEVTRSAALAGCNSLYRYDTGYPSKEYFKAVYPEAENVPDKLVGRIAPLGSCAGYLVPEMAAKLGLLVGTPVGVGMIDSHSAVMGCGASQIGDMVSTIGTSANNMLNAVEGPGIPGIYSAAPDANIPGLFGYEGGQNCVGDALAWYVDYCVPASYVEAAKAEGVNIHAYLQARAEKLKPGESGLIALDWFNGVRTPLMDFSLTSAIVGLSVRTKPEEIYRALVEAVVFGNKQIIDVYEEAGCPVNRIIAAGGIPMKNSMMMQIYADVTNKDIYLCGSAQTCARGSAILGAAAAGPEVHGCKDIYELIDKLGKLSDVVYHPIPENVEKYKKIYALYKQLSHEMAKDGGVMKELLKLKNEL
ncbi:MAG: ribulokinase [Lachnospiraceae bacterium]|nr:ribulokinase [Lachnospiraceae bacterium]